MATAIPDALALVGHPLRWRLLGELGRSDRRVHELTTAVGEPQNLVSYHLRQLRQAELVRTRRSTADGRDTYYALDLGRFESMLVDAGGAIHPGLRLGRQTAPVGRGRRRRILFLCTGNSARSQIAEALAEHRAGGWLRAASAGSHPKPLHPMAVRVLRDRYGLDIAGAHAKHVDEIVDQRFDRVITLCDRVREVCPEFPGQPDATHWSVPDPAAGVGGEHAFLATAEELDARIGFLVAALAAEPPTHPAHPKEAP